METATSAEQGILEIVVISSADDQPHSNNEKSVRPEVEESNATPPLTLATPVEDSSHVIPTIVVEEGVVSEKISLADNLVATEKTTVSDTTAEQPAVDVSTLLKEKLKMSLKRKTSSEEIVVQRSRHVRIDHFQRPLNIKGLVQWLSDICGLSIFEDAVWINGIKTHCYLDLSSEEEAERCIQVITGQRYPSTNTNTLVASFSSISVKDAPQSMEANQKIADTPKPVVPQKPRDLEELKRSLKRRKVDGEGEMPSSGNLFKRATLGALGSAQTVSSSPAQPNRAMNSTAELAQPTGASFSSGTLVSTQEGKKASKAITRTTVCNPEIAWVPVDDDIAERRIKLYRRLGNRV